MAKTTFDPKSIQLTGIPVVTAGARTTGSQFSVPLPGLVKPNAQGTGIVSRYDIRPFPTSKWGSNINGLMVDNKINTNSFGLIIVDAALVPEIKRREKMANDEIQILVQNLLANYEEWKAQELENIRGIYEANRKKSLFNPKKLKFPTPGEIASAKIYVPLEMIDPEQYHLLPAGTQSIIDDAVKEQAAADHRNHLHTRCAPVLECLAKMTKQFLGGKLHGGTINAYMNAVDTLKQANAIEFKPGLPEFDAFLKVHSYAVDLPTQYLDLFQVAWMKFYFMHGLIDLFPYESFDVSREDIEMMFADDSEPVKGFVDIVQSLQN
jgi:hypothetical protein